MEPRDLLRLVIGTPCIASLPGLQQKKRAGDLLSKSCITPDFDRVDIDARGLSSQKGDHQNAHEAPQKKCASDDATRGLRFRGCCSGVGYYRELSGARLEGTRL